MMESSVKKTGRERTNCMHAGNFNGVCLLAIRRPSALRTIGVEGFREIVAIGYLGRVISGEIRRVLINSGNENTGQL